MATKEAVFEDDVMAAIGAVETARAETGLVDIALETPERRERIREVLRDVYAEQGQEVDDATLDRAIAIAGENRFRHSDDLKGPERLFALAYVRRGRILAALAVLCVIGVGFVAIEDARERSAIAERQAAADRTDLQLARARAAFASVSEDAGRKGVPAQTIDEATARFNRAVAARDAPDASDAVVSLRDEIAGLDGRRALASLETDAETAIATARSAATAPDARSAIEPLVSELQDVLRRDDPSQDGRDALAAATVAVRGMANRIATPLEVRVVDRGDQKSGVVRTNPEGVSLTYLIVEAVGPDGRPVQRAVTDFETGRRAAVATFGVQVPREVFDRIRKDKADGVIDSPVIGRKPPGTLAIGWDVPTSGNFIVKW